MNRILFLGASEFQIPVIEKAKEMGKYVGVADISNTAPGLKYADECFECSVKDIDGIMSIAKKFKPDAITVGICDSAINTAAYVCKELGLPFHSPEVANKVTNKYEMIKAFKAHNIPAPDFMLIKKDDIEKSVVDMPFPLISKPVDAAGSKGINLITSKDNMLEAFEDSSRCGTSGDILVEEFMTGAEVSVEIVITDKRAKAVQVTDKLITGAPYFIEVGHAQPSRFVGKELETIKKVAESATEALGIDNGVAHAEVILTENGPKMVEIGGRLGGGGISGFLTEISTGISFTEIAIRQAFGEKIKINNPCNINSCAIRFILSEEGTVKAITGIDEANESKNVKLVKVHYSIGDKGKKAVDNSARIGYVVATAQTTDMAINFAENALKKIKIELK